MPAIRPSFTVTNPTPYTSNETGLQNLTSNLLGSATIVAGLAFLAFLIVGGLQWITAGGDEKAITTAKNKITQGFIGLAILVFAWSIVAIVQAVLGISILDFTFPKGRP